MQEVIGIAKRETRRINKNDWDTYVSNVRYDVHGPRNLI
jgi:hypothetical protein